MPTSWPEIALRWIKYILRSKVCDEAAGCCCSEYYLALPLVCTVASQVARAREGTARLTGSKSPAVRQLCTQRQLFTAMVNDCTMPSKSRQELTAVKNLAGRWWRGLSVWYQLCLGGWQIFHLLGSSIACLIPFPFSVVLQLDCFVLTRFLLPKWVGVSQGLMAQASCHCTHRWLCHWDTRAMVGGRAETQNTRSSLALSPLSQAGQWKRGGITTIGPTMLPAAGSFL